MNQANKGFTLIEILIAVAIVGILASIAMPAYNEYTRTSRRAAIQSCLMEHSQQMERYKTTNMTYVGAPNPVCQGGAAASYNVGFSAGPAATTFTLQAVPTGDQASSSNTCSRSTLTVDQTGAKTPANCW